MDPLYSVLLWPPSKAKRNYTKNAARVDNNSLKYFLKQSIIKLSALLKFQQQTTTKKQVKHVEIKYYVISSRLLPRFPKSDATLCMFE